VTVELRHWDGEWPTHPQELVRARSVEDVVAVMKDAGRYPAPVRPHGSGHSPANCREADGGTVIDMLAMDRVVSIGEETATFEAGMLYIDTAKELERRGLQHYVNTEIGSLTVGSAACCQTKDAAMPGEHGQLSAYVTGMKIVTPQGEVTEITEEEPELMQAARSSFGLFGVVVEVTFRVKPLQRLAVEHKTFKTDDLVDQLPELVALDKSLMMYFFPFIDRVLVELRRYTGETGSSGRPNRTSWRLRNFTWRAITPGAAKLAERLPRRLRGPVADGFDHVLHVLTGRLVASSKTVPTDQMIRYPHKAGWTGFTSSIWAFPEETFRTALPEYRDFVKAYDAEHAWRPNMPAVGYRQEQDQSSLLSYSWDGPVLTIDPVSTQRPGWYEFLDEFNEFCSERGGSPLINQAPGLTREHVDRAFGDRLRLLDEHRRRFDPEDRLLSEYFRELLPIGKAATVDQAATGVDER
jgi:FAD/FMN-containing dehydrogenase